MARPWGGMIALDLGLAAALCLAACSAGGGSAPASSPPDSIAVESPAFADGATIPRRYTCEGEDTSPPLRWSKVPAGTAEVALVVDDPDAPGGTFVHWVVVHLDPGRRALAEGSLPPGARQARNSAGKAAWLGPCPPKGPAHHYRFTVYALQRRVAVDPSTGPDQARSAIERLARVRGRLVGTFAR